MQISVEGSPHPPLLGGGRWRANVIKGKSKLCGEHETATVAGLSRQYQGRVRVEEGGDLTHHN